MTIRIRLRLGPRLARHVALHRHVALLLGTLMSPAALMAFALGCWRLGSDLNWTGEFVIERGFFSHWQVWLAFAAGLQTCASILNRYGRAERAAA